MTLMLRFLLLLPFALCMLLSTAQAQLQVGMQIKRRLFVQYEPIVATVFIRNLSGRDIPLMDQDNKQWFGFSIYEGGERPLVAYNPDYQTEPIIIPAGETIQRKVVLNHMYPVNSLGSYRIKAQIYFAALDQYFESPPFTVEITTGRAISEQTVGVPEGLPGAGELRRYTVMTFRRTDHNYIYVKVENPDNGAVFCCQPIGRLITAVGAEPEIKLDRDNQLHILHLTGPKMFRHTMVSLNGELLGQETYMAAPMRPTLRVAKSGDMVVVGGVLYNKNNMANELGVPAAPNIPKLSDRPPLPKS